MKLRFRGRASRLSQRTLGRLVFAPSAGDNPSDTFLGLRTHAAISLPDLRSLGSYAGVLVEGDDEPAGIEAFGGPLIQGLSGIDSIEAGSVVAASPNGEVRVLYRPSSPNNSIFATGECNSNCLMCSQPPLIAKNQDLVAEHLRMIELIQTPPPFMGITGGEPTLLGDGLLDVLRALRRRFPDSGIHMLTNGRMYAYRDCAERVSEAGEQALMSAIPLYADTAGDHDHIVQAKGAFDQTMTGLYNAARFGMRIELRVVLHRLTIPRLVPLAEFIYRNLPFVEHIALMGLEHMGYVRMNWQQLWIDPVDYSKTLERAVRALALRRMNVSIYNLPLCVVPESLWRFARKSISDFKNEYLPECDDCVARDGCGGLFASWKGRHSRGIRSLHTLPGLAQVSRLGQMGA
jgi:His-Xaa-Ser system radical SAM maturase HxsC